MARDTQQIKVEETDRIDLYGPTCAIIIRCQCGHSREIFSNHATWKFGPAVTVGQFKAHLRCSRCGARMPHITVYRRPRD